MIEDCVERGCIFWLVQIDGQDAGGPEVESSRGLCHVEQKCCRCFHSIVPTLAGISMPGYANPIRGCKCQCTVHIRSELVLVT